ncbi:MAG: helix-turn-helix transcriptional regulator [Candidatus Bathyarchaeota archaeon]|nr:MAG: helix-turn-helix transcriptional regulator [Candidatus Bathyarchaeota archaeon]
MKDVDQNEAFMKDMKRRFVKSFLDMLILKLIQDEPIWGYKILRETESLYQVKLRHGALYPLLNKLKTSGYIRSEQELHKGRIRKIYQITPSGTQLLNTYQNFLGHQLHSRKEKKENKK